jgi:outer membrane protein OmpA-like peptidoglycan-associated protein
MMRSVVALLITVPATLAMAADAATATLTGKVTELWTAKPVGGVTVTVRSAAGTVLGTDRTVSNGEFTIHNLPKRKQKTVEIRYELDDWERHPTKHYRALEEDIVHDNARLCEKPTNQQQAAELGTLLYRMETSGGDTTEGRAIFGSMPADAQSAIAMAYAAQANQMSDPSAIAAQTIARKVLTSFENALERDTTLETRLQIYSVLQEIAEIAVLRSHGRESVAITVNGSYFDVASASVAPEVKALYQQLATYLRNPSIQSISVEGHADSSGPETLNQALASKRALNVSDVLIENGVAKEKVRAVGMGEAQPMQNRKQPNPFDRRVDVILRFDVGYDERVYVAR